MKIPKYLMNGKVRIQNFKGQGAYGPIYDEPYEIDCRVEPYVKLIHKKDGNEVTSSTRLFINCNKKINTESKIEIVQLDGVNFDVAEEHIAIEYRPRYGFKFSYAEVVLK